MSDPVLSHRIPSRRPGRRSRALKLLTAGLALALAAPWLPSTAQAGPGRDSVRLAREIDAKDLRVSGPVGLAWSRRADALLVAAGDATGAELGVVDRDAPAGPRRRLSLEGADPINLGFDERGGRLVYYEARSEQLVLVAAGADGLPEAGRREHLPVRRYGILDAAGLTADPVTGRIYLLDAAGPRLLVVEPDADGGLRGAALTELWLELPGPLRGLAFDPSSGHLHVLSPEAGRLYELDAAGEVVANRDLSPFGLRAPQGMVFAPSGDSTDDPVQQSLYVAEAEATVPGGESAGGIAELSLVAVAQPAATVPVVTATLVRRVLTSQYDPESPDPMGLEYIDHTDTLLMSDSEIEEIPTRFTGDNIWEIDYQTGQMLGTASTLEPIDYSDEPTGVAYDPVARRLFIAHDDGGGKYFVVTAGGDGFYFTADDNVREVATSGDSEGIAFERIQRVVYIADGVDSEVYRISPGNDGTYGTGDDSETHFDTAAHGLTDPEAIASDPFSGNLYVGGGNPDTLVLEMSPQGQLVRVIDVSDANPPNPSGMAYGPGSQNPSLYSLYIADRGVDNDSQANENDGQLFEVSFPGASPGNTPPVVDAGPNLQVTLPNTAFLNATVSDAQGQTLSYQWTKVSGPGTVGFGNPQAVDTTASFSAAGSYVLQLAASDGELTGSDQTTVTVSGPGGLTVLDVRVAAGSDDAEQELATGAVSLGSSDLELVADHGANQVVGVRFTGLAIPPGASILDAWIQFQVDETSSAAAALTFRGQRTANAATFTSAAGSLSARPTTGAFTSWAPPAWSQAGQAGAAQQTPSLAAIVAEIVSLPGWASGNTMVFLVTGSGSRTAEAFEGAPAGAPLLHVEFSSQPNAAPSVTLTQPANGSSFTEGQSIAFAGSASDSEDGNLTASLAWNSSLQGPIGTGGSFSRSNLVPGSHTITASVTDSGGRSASAQRTITVVANAPNTPPTVSISAPANGASFNQGTPVGFSGSASDGQDGNLSTSITWSSSRDGFLGSGASLTTSNLSIGTHTITASASDSGGLAGSAQISISVVTGGGGVPGVTEVRVSASSDDAEEKGGSVSLTSSDLELVTDASPQTVGIRFAGLAVPRGASITSAYVQFQVDAAGSDPTSLTIRGQASDQAATFTTASGNLSQRPTTAASAAWSPQAWTTAGQAGAAQRTPSLAAIVQEIVSRPGWAPGNALALMITGTGKRTAEAFNGEPTGAPLLHVEYSAPPNDPPSVSLLAPASGASFATGQAILFQGTASDTEDGNLTASLGWSSSLDGPLGSGGSFTRSNLSGGTHVITTSVMDSGARTTSAQVTIQVAGASGGTVLDVQVSLGANDAEQDTVSGSVSLGSSDLEMTLNSQIIGMRFAGVAIPRGAPILAAWLQFQVDETDTVATSLTIRGQAADNAAAFQASAGNLSLRPITSAATAWAPPAWTTVGQAGPGQRSPDLGALIQEIVNRPGWVSGNALVLLITGTGQRTAEAFEGDPTGAPVLHVEFGSP